MQCRHRVSPVGYFINLSYRLKRLFNTYGNTAMSRQLRVQDVGFLVFQGWDSCFAQNKLGRDALHRLDYQNCLGNFWTVSKTMDLQSGYLISHVKETASVNRNGMHFHQSGQPFVYLKFNWSQRGSSQSVFNLHKSWERILTAVNSGDMKRRGSQSLPTVLRIHRLVGGNSLVNLTSQSNRRMKVSLIMSQFKPRTFLSSAALTSIPR